MIAPRVCRYLGALFLWLALAVPAEAHTTVTLAWDPNPEPEVTGYTVYVGTVPGSFYTSFNVGNRTNWTITGLTNSVQYYFGVQARSSTGAVSPVAVLGHVTPPVVPPNSEGARSDFNGDGRFDLVWQHSSTSQLVAWHMNGAAVVSSRFLTPSAVGAGWNLKGSGDLNQDGKPDLIFQSNAGDLAFWLMDGAFNFGFGWLNPNKVDPIWQIVSVRDMNNDSHPDIIWQHSTTGQVLCWFMNGGNAIGTGWLNPAPLADTNWKLRGVADFSGDGRNDLVWHNHATGQLLLWAMNGTTATAVTTTPGAVGPGWRIMAVGDANLDGAPDLVWENESTGQVVIWAMIGANMFSAPLVGTVDPAWKISSPR
jgi:hypothetical protein